jgi:hypothetical protein
MSRSPPFKPPPIGRVALGKREGERLRFSAKASRFGSRVGHDGRTVRTIMLSEVHEAGSDAVLTEHLWLDRGKWSAELKIGDRFEFDARVANYIKGPVRGKQLYELAIDWQLQRPTRVVILEAAPVIRRVRR